MVKKENNTVNACSSVLYMMEVPYKTKANNSL